MKVWRVLVLFCFILLAVFLNRCKQTETQQSKTQVYLNHSDTVDYIGMQTCQTCHVNVHESFIHTGMGQSFGLADSSKSIAEINGESLIYDEHLDFYYQPYWANDTLFLKEFRLLGGDTVHSQIQKMDYVVGSGQHTNSHIFKVKDYLFQAPFTWYAQKGRLDLPPGFEEGGNTRFSRKIGLECMSCHNAMPNDFQMGSTNKFHNVDLGINCERCHGPGEAHVNKIRSGDITDTSKYIDYSIVNPKKLSADLQFELCQRCHLQGNAVLKEGKSFFDFKPGMRLSDVMEVYLPKYSNAEDKFIMASHVDRFKQSECFIQSEGKFNCIACHNPHVSVRETKISSFNKKCSNCHSADASNFCLANEDSLKALEYNCVVCHMPSSTSIDIPHVTVHDHFIRTPKKTKAQNLAESKFLGLFAVNNSVANNRGKALAYLQQFERFSPKKMFLDSAALYLSKINPSHEEYLFLNVYYYYLSVDYNGLMAFVEQNGGLNVLEQLDSKSWQNKDAWTAYRIAESYKTTALETALAFYQKSVELAPYVLDFRIKLANMYSLLQQNYKALKEYDFVLKENPRHKEALNNKAYLALQSGNLALADSLLKKAKYYYPDYELMWQNIFNLRYQQGDIDLAKKALEEIIGINPQNENAQILLKQINSAS